MSEEFRFQMYDKIEEMAKKTERKKLIGEFLEDLNKSPLKIYIN